MSVLKEFREFAVRGSVVDLAVGLVIGAAFGKIVTSAVSDLLTPPLGLLIGGVDFKHLKIVLRQGVDTLPPITLNYGVFLQHVLDFAIVAVAVFAVVKLINRMRPKVAPPAPPVVPPPTREQELLVEIRDALLRVGR